MDIQDKLADIETKITFGNKMLVNAIHELQEIKNELQRRETESERTEEEISSQVL